MALPPPPRSPGPSGASTFASVVALLALSACGAARLPTPPSPPPRITIEVPAGESLALPYDAPGVHIRSGELVGLDYAEVIVGEVEEGTPLPLVVALHGVGDAPRFPTGTVLRTGTPMRLVLPRGPRSYGGLSAWSAQRVRDGDPAVLAAELTDAADRIAALTVALAGSHPTAGTPIVTGFSQGAMVAWLSALRHPDAFGLAILAAGWLSPAAAEGPCGTPLRIVHGLEDRIVPIEPARAAAAALSARGCDVEWLELPGVEHQVDAPLNEVLERWLEEALLQRTPDARGGVGERGPDPEPYTPVSSPLLLLGE